MQKSFDAVAWMRRRREQIDREDQRLSWEEKRRKTHALLEDDFLWRRLKGRVVTPSSNTSHLLVSEAGPTPADSYAPERKRD